MFKELVEKAADERAEQTTGRIAVVFLGITQIALFLILANRLYLQGQPDAEVRDIQLVLALSIFGYIGARLWLGGILPTLNLKSAFTAWALLAGSIAGVCLVIYGVPSANEWAVTWLPALGGPALLIAAYAAIAWLGKKRLERQIEE